jgi:hypothetical protein
MALILAIEPDRRQANHLTAMVRGRLRAELVLGDTAERALAALGDRVPDLVLTTTLLSPRDEAEADRPAARARRRRRSPADAHDSGVGIAERQEIVEGRLACCRGCSATEATMIQPTAATRHFSRSSAKNT